VTVLLHLTNEEEEMLEGEYGYPLELAMTALVKVGDMYGADKMIDIDNVHVDASTYSGIYDAGLEFCLKLSKEKARFRVPTTLCISAIDFDSWRKLRISTSFAKKQIELAKAYAKMGASPTWTCSPYQYGSGIRFGQNIAWGESNAIVFANSVVGARTNRYGDLLDVCAGLVGKVPRFGLYLDKNRYGEVVLTLRTNARNLRCSDYAALGYHVGAIAGQKIPVIEGVPVGISIDHLKSFGAAVATSGSIALFHMVGVTPEARTTSEALGCNVPGERISIGDEELERSTAGLSTVHDGKADFIVLGCPHYSVEQIQEVMALLKGRKVRRNVQVWIFTNRMAKRLAEDKALVKVVESAGGMVLTDTCPLHLQLRKWNFQTMATDSAKMANYAPSLLGVEVIFADTRECIEYAIGKRDLVEAKSWKRSC
jgi:predicted aconitase